MTASLIAAAPAAAQMTVAETRAIIEPYAASHDPRYLTEDAVFVHMATGERHEGREAVGRMLNYIYHEAFDAHAEPLAISIGEGTATLEATFVGRHIGTFAGIEPTGREVRVPLAVTYEVTPEGISGARVYMAMSVMFAQLGASPPASGGE
jgi:hypothetical protein